MKHKVHRQVLSNNMRILLIPVQNLDIVSVGFFIKVGSRYETEETNGISHFLEHMMFKGTKKYPGNKLFQTLDNMGARYNAETSFEYTNYYIYGNVEHMDTYMDVLLDIYEHPTFKDEDIKIERGVVFEEINMYKDDIDDIMYRKIHEIFFPNSPLHFPILGKKQLLKNIGRKELTNFRKRFYSPDRTVLVICGSFDKDKVMAKYKSRLSSIKDSSDDIYIPISDPPIQTQRAIHYINNTNMSTPYIALCFKSGSFFSRYSDSYDIISDALTSGSSSRFYTLLREKLGIAYNVESENINYHYEGVFCIFVSTENKNMSKVINSLLKEIEYLVDKGLKEEELEKSKKMRLSSILLSLQTPLDLMSYYGLNETNYRVGNIDIDNQYKTKLKNRINNIMSLSLDTINNVMRDLFSPEKLNIIIAGKSKYKFTT